ncbi:unnamed protein product [Hydatigera taeniaeformis]|uniref:WD_REPEATS_REGION domain-containing protein n=1 Tax=Hydatigena taeniaeformis TaxID=6205 RepID=A0A0R3WR06_HYDTA|nr:unnamed protein product [Hydatigera taeniaeformis]
MQQTASLFVVKLDRHTSSLTVAKEEQKDSLSFPLDSSLKPALCPLSSVITASDTASLITESPDSQPTSGYQRSAVITELQATFTPEMAYITYIPLCRLAAVELKCGRIGNNFSAFLSSLTPNAGFESPFKLYVGGSHIESSLYNINHIHSLVRQHEASLHGSDNGTTGPTGRVKVTINTEYEAKLVASSSVSKSAVTHLHGEWVEYFRAKVETCPSLPVSPLVCGPPRLLKFIGKHLVTFSGALLFLPVAMRTTCTTFVPGHNGAVRSITPLVNENSFVTTSNDHNVLLYSLTSARESAAVALVASYASRRTVSDSGAFSDRLLGVQSPPSVVASPATQLTPVAPSLVFTGHRRAVFASAYLHFERLVASLDPSLLLLWDPVTGQKVFFVIG